MLMRGGETRHKKEAEEGLSVAAAETQSGESLFPRPAPPQRAFLPCKRAQPACQSQPECACLAHRRFYNSFFLPLSGHGLASSCLLFTCRRPSLA